MIFRRACTRWGCGKEVPQDRVLRSTFCSPECRNEDKKARRRASHDRFCYACGRSAKKPKEAGIRIKVSHPKNCGLCEGTTWVSEVVIRIGGQREVVRRCPNWSVVKLNLGEEKEVAENRQSHCPTEMPVNESGEIAPRLCLNCGGQSWEHCRFHLPAHCYVRCVTSNPPWDTEEYAAPTQDKTPKTANEEGGLPSRVEATDGEPLPDGPDSFTLPPGCF